MTTLQETIKNRQPIKVYLIDSNNEEFYYDTMEYNEAKKRYEGKYGNIPIEKIPSILADKLEHIKLESV